MAQRNGQWRKRGSLGPERATADDLLKLVNLVYEAGADQNRWPEVLRKTVRVVGSSGSHLLLADNQTGKIAYSTHVNMPDEMIEQYNGEYIHICPRYACSKAHPNRDLLWDYQHIDEHGIDHSEYYNWLQREGEGIRYYLGARLRPLGEKEAFISYISLAFRKRDGHATQEQIRLLGKLLPHFKRALDIRRTTGKHDLALTASLEFLNRLSDAVVLLGASGIVLVANQAAVALAQPGGKIQLGTHSVRLQHRELNTTLQRLISGAMETARGTSTAGGGTLRVSGTPDYVISVVPLIGPVADATLALARVAIFFRTTQRHMGPSAEDLQNIFDLTLAEARLACLLVEGKPLADVATQLGISIHTARAHLRQLFGKTGTHRQAELIQLLAGLGVNPLGGDVGKG